MNKAIKKYLDLVKSNPKCFINPPGKSTITIVTDIDKILNGQQIIHERLSIQGKPLHWGDIGVLAEDSWFYVVRDLVVFPGGFINGYIRMINKTVDQGAKGVVILPIWENKIILIEHFRHEMRSLNLEIPRGFGEIGFESSTENAKNELKEEIGVIPDKIINLCENIPSGPFEEADYFIAYVSNFSEVLPLDGSSEGIASLKAYSINEVKDLIKNRELTDTFTITCFTLALLHGYIT
jgi:ADP-ribose pyrophosphatase